MNGIVSLFTEIPRMTMQNVYDVGFIVLIANAMIAFLLNVSVVFLVRLSQIDYLVLFTDLTRLAKLPLSSSLYAVSSRTSYWSLPA